MWFVSVPYITLQLYYKYIRVYVRASKHFVEKINVDDKNGRKKNSWCLSYRTRASAQAWPNNLVPTLIIIAVCLFVVFCFVFVAIHLSCFYFPGYLFLLLYIYIFINFHNFSSEIMTNLTEDHEDTDEILDCGNSVNFTNFDDLIGIAQRHNHPIVPEPEVNESFTY